MQRDGNPTRCARYLHILPEAAGNRLPGSALHFIVLGQTIPTPRTKALWMNLPVNPTRIRESMNNLSLTRLSSSSIEHHDVLFKFLEKAIVHICLDWPATHARYLSPRLTATRHPGNCRRGRKPAARTSSASFAYRHAATMTARLQSMINILYGFIPIS